MPKMFANPTYDIAFKRLFGNANHANLTKSFLNTVLNRKNEHLIEEITFVNTEKTPRFHQEKKTYIDIQCKDKAGHEFIIEMQSTKEDSFEKRAQYYVAHGLSRQLENRGFYTGLKPVIFVGVLGFNLLDSDKKSSAVITQHLITNQSTQKQDLDLMEFHFIELPKFKKTEKELVTEADRWFYFLKEATELDEIPQSCAQSADVKEAFEIMERANWDAKTWGMYEEERKLQIYFATQEYEQQLKQQENKKIEAAQKVLEAAQKALEASQKVLEQENEQLRQTQELLKQQTDELKQQTDELK